MAAIAALAIWRIAVFVGAGVPWTEAGIALLLGLATMLRVFVLILLASIIWVPVGVWIGLHPKVTRIVQPVAQFMDAFPANLFFPVAVSAIVMFRLDPAVWQIGRASCRERVCQYV